MLDHLEILGCATETSNLARSFLSPVTLSLLHTMRYEHVVTLLDMYSLHSVYFV